MRHSSRSAPGDIPAPSYRAAARAARTCSAPAQALEQTGGRAVQAGEVAALQTRLDIAGQHLAQFHAPLIEAVDAPDRAAREHSVLLQRQQRAQARWRQLVQQQEGAGPIAGKVAVPARVRLAV